MRFEKFIPSLGQWLNQGFCACPLNSRICKCMDQNSGSQRLLHINVIQVVKGIKVIYRTLYLSKYDDRINIKIHKDVKCHLYDKK